MAAPPVSRTPCPWFSRRGLLEAHRRHKIQEIQHPDSPRRPAAHGRVMAQTVRRRPKRPSGSVRPRDRELVLVCSCLSPVVVERLRRRRGLRNRRSEVRILSGVTKARGSFRPVPRSPTRRRGSCAARSRDQAVDAGGLSLALDVRIGACGVSWDQSCASTLITTPWGSRTKKRRTPQGSSTGP